jgi:ABC-type nickel/cobalt efflux system permease component RcnA
MTGILVDYGAPVAFLMAVLLGLRHATDPDHLTAVSTLLLAETGGGIRRAAGLGLAWGTGHAITLFAFGLPAVFFGRFLPPALEHAVEALIGVIIVGLAVRLLLRWHQGGFHVHPHRHGSIWHAHPHAHDHRHQITDHSVQHHHHHSERLGRSPRQAFGIGSVHGVGGSAGIGVLLAGSVADHLHGTMVLLAFAAATAASMALVSAGFAYALTRPVVKNRLSGLVPFLAAASMVFGVWYSLDALRSAV